MIKVSSSFLLLAATAALLAFSANGALYCKDEAGQDVDWFVAYKIPRQANEPAPLNTGFSYAYMTGKPIAGRGAEQTSGWKLGSSLITDAESMFGKTLAPVYANPAGFSTVQYNDDPPATGGDGYRAHAKGVLAMDKETGFWLIHSVPNYAPEFTESYSYPETGRLNGQTLLCISFKTATEADKIAQQLTYMQPNIYSMQITNEVDPLAPQLRVLETKKAVEGTESVVEIKSIKGSVFQSFSKSRKASNELYSDMVAPQLGTDLLVETWRRGAGGSLTSNCSRTVQNSVNNINEVSLQLIKSPLTTTNAWNYLSDHAKWAVSSKAEKPFSCIGDINRMASQTKRGGGTVCFQSPAVWSVLRDSVSGIEPCPK